MGIFDMGEEEQKKVKKLFDELITEFISKSGSDESMDEFTKEDYIKNYNIFTLNDGEESFYTCVTCKYFTPDKRIKLFGTCGHPDVYSIAITNPFDSLIFTGEPRAEVNVDDKCYCDRYKNINNENI